MNNMIIQIMENRDKRVLHQKELCDIYHLPLISFTLNIAGNIKKNKLFDILFNLGCKEIELALISNQIKLKEILLQDSGNTAFYVYNLSAEFIKRAMIEIEDFNDLSRLFDIDVIDNETYTPLSRTQFGNPPRSCLICRDVPYLICRRNNTHSFGEIIHKTKEISNKSFSRILSNIARFSLECELSTSPKPGLVDRLNNGSHTDMNYPLFLKSIESITPFLELEYMVCFDNLNKNELFKKMKSIGLEGERTMLESTNGINTHKGAFFSLSTIGCAISYSISNEDNISIDNIKQFSKEFGEWARLNNDTNISHGDNIRKNIGNYGIYDETISGYLSVFSKCYKYLSLFREDKQLNVFFTKLISNYEFDENIFNEKIEPLSLRIMCTLLSSAKDSNIIYRGGLKALLAINNKFSEIDSYNYCDKELKEILINEDIDFVKNNLSPGGVADLLTLVIFTMTLVSLDIIKL
ncbi:MAG: citrate lyase holo-[acyl-carrier protein] synthase [Spirochaetaceae bacterium]|nr:citrate lyase holo-[acyl-carrier protein] synthase [Spirochaetaceae bacterium]